MRIKYQIKMLTDWHVGSGLDSGANADSLVLKDSNRLPYIPGKTIKGLLKDALNEMADVKPELKEHINHIFGYAKANTEKESDKSTEKEADKSTVKGTAFFSNAELSEEEQNDIVTNKYQSYLYRNLATTAIAKNGIAKAKSLRTMEVTMPLTLEGEIEVTDSKDVEVLEMAFKWLRHLGVNRNRGLGRCKFFKKDQ